MITEVKKGCEIQPYKNAWWGLYKIVEILYAARFKITLMALSEAGKDLCESFPRTGAIMEEFASLIREEQKNQAVVGMCRTYGIPGMRV